MIRMRKLSVLLTGLLALLWSCKPEQQAKETIRSVKVSKVLALNESQHKITLPATVNERRAVELAFRVGGPLVDLNNIVGSYVEKGQVIARIDKRDFQVGLSKIESNYKLAKAEYERYKELLKQKSVSQSFFDKMEAQYLLAKGNYEDAKNAYDDTDLKAPFSGFISQVFVENFEKVNPGQPIVSFLDLSSYKVSAWVAADDAQKISPQTRFVCNLSDGQQSYQLEGTLLELGSKASHTKQSYPVSVLIEPTKEMHLRAGMTATLDVYPQIQDEIQACVVPLTAVFSADEQNYVWVLKDNTVNQRKVELGTIVSDQELMITHGLQAGETIVSAGVHYLNQGEHVRIYQGFSKTNKGNQL